MDKTKNKVSKHVRDDFIDPIKKTFNFYGSKLMCSFSLMASQKCSLDMVEFENLMIYHHGYNPRLEQSLAEFVREKFNQEAVDLVLRLIDGIDVTELLSRVGSTKGSEGK